MSTFDQELKALETILRTLLPLTPEERQRVLEYVQTRSHAMKAPQAKAKPAKGRS